MVRINLVEAAERRRLLEHELELQDLEELRAATAPCEVCGAPLRRDNRSRRCLEHRDKNRYRKARRCGV